jgi:CubicO group peptidase (beta-lactamase class C family)
MNTPSVLLRASSLVLVLLTIAGCAIYIAPIKRDKTEMGDGVGKVDKVDRVDKGDRALPAVPLRDAAKTTEAAAFLEGQTAFDACVAMKGEAEIMRWGKADLPINTHSARKSLLSVLFGIAADKGLVNIDASLASLGIDEPQTPLSPVERSATVRQLLQSRSGIYLEAAGETDAMKAGRPRRGQFVPGANFYYNNWDFNVLGAIFEQQTRLSIGEAIAQWLATPLGMSAFDASYVTYQSAARSQYRQFVIYMSAADLARVGMMMAQGGTWKGHRIVSAAWVDESLRAHSRVTEPRPFDGYGYMWWNDSRDGTVWADGWRGQYMIVDRARQMVVVSRNDTGRDLISLGWAVLFGRDGFRDHHQKLHRLMVEAVQTAS